MTVDRLFFAVRPDAAAAERIAELAQALRREHALRGRALRTDRFHVTLYFLGDYVGGLPQGVVERASEAADGVAAGPFEAVFDTVLSFARRRHRPLVLSGDDGVVSLQALRQALDERLRALGLGEKGRSKFTPHLTLLYDDHGVQRQTIDPITWTVREFVLIHSLVGKSEHRVVGRWPLDR